MPSETTTTARIAATLCAKPYFPCWTACRELPAAAELTDRLREWFAQLPELATIVFDYELDWLLLAVAMLGRPKKDPPGGFAKKLHLDSSVITHPAFEKASNQAYGQEWPAHHALADARALMAGYRAWRAFMENHLETAVSDAPHIIEPVEAKGGPADLLGEIERAVHDDDDAAAKSHSAAGRAIYYGDPKYPGQTVRQYPDGSRQLVSIDRANRAYPVDCQSGDSTPNSRHEPTLFGRGSPR